MKDQIACFFWTGREYVITRGITGTEVLASFKTLRETRAFVESYNAKLAAASAPAPCLN